MMTKHAAVGLTILAMVLLPQPSQAFAFVDCETERLIDEALYGADEVDSDLDGISNEAEARFLGTNPCKEDSDDDDTNDGYDAMPLTNNVASGVPLQVTIAYINQIEVPSGCDDGTTWDPFFDGFSFAVPELGLNTPNLEAGGWTRADHTMNRPNANSDIELLPTGGNGFTAAGNGINFDLDPDLSLWGGGLFPKLNLRFAGMIVDDDKNYDDSMTFGTQDEDVLFEEPASLKLQSSRAVDGDGGRINCKAEIGLVTDLAITDAVVEAFYELQKSGGPSGNSMDPGAQCSGMNRCISTPRVPPIAIPSVTAPYDAGTAGEPCDDPVLWSPYLFFPESAEVWSLDCQEQQND